MQSCSIIHDISKVTLLVLLLSSLFTACTQPPKERDNYPKDSAISDIHGKPHDSLTFYFPSSIRKDSNIVQVEMENYFKDFFSSDLYCMKEPILSNYYLAQDFYRFLWLRSFNRPVLLVLNKDNDKVWLSLKVLDIQPQFIDINHLVFHKNQKTRKQKVSISSEGHFEDSLVKANRQATLIVNITKQLTVKEWSEFETLLKKCSFWATKPFIEEFGIDGSQWTIEAHQSNKYWFVSRHSPKDGFYQAGQFLINLAGLTEHSFEY